MTSHPKMVERKHSGSYEVNEKPRHLQETGWCGTRFMVYMTTVACFIIYIIGSVITGITYRGQGVMVNCSDKFQTTELFAYHTPLVVVGPCLMSAGGAILIYLLLQWFLCRPALN